MSLIDQLQDALTASSDWIGSSPASEAEIDRINQFLAVPLPSSYTQFLRRFNGGRGGLGAAFTGAHFMSVAEVIRYQDYWMVDKQMPGTVLIGADFAGFGLLLDVRMGMTDGEYPILVCPLSSLWFEFAEVAAAGFPQYFYQLLEN